MQLFFRILLSIAIFILIGMFKIIAAIFKAIFEDSSQKQHKKHSSRYDNYDMNDNAEIIVNVMNEWLNN